MSVRPDLNPGVATITTATAAPPTSFSKPGGHAPVVQRAEVALEPAVLTHRREVVDHAEEAEAEHREQHREARPGEPRLRPHADRAEHRATGVDDEHGEDDEEPARGRERVTAVVAALQRGRRQDLAAHHPQEAHRHEADEERDDRGHGSAARFELESRAHGASDCGTADSTEHHAREEDHDRSFGHRGHHPGDGDAGVVEREPEQRHDAERDRGDARVVDTLREQRARASAGVTHHEVGHSTASATRQQSSSECPSVERFSAALRRRTSVAAPKSVPTFSKNLPTWVRWSAGRSTSRTPTTRPAATSTPESTHTVRHRSS